MRVHTGTGSTFSERPVIHVFLNRGNFLWNNRCDDTAVLRAGVAFVDWAYFNPGPAEGAMVRRLPGTNELR